MSSLPVVSGRDCVRALTRLGFVADRRRGSHIILVRQDPYTQVVVPDHRELDRGTLRGILRHADATVADFVELLKG